MALKMLICVLIVSMKMVTAHYLYNSNPDPREIVTGVKLPEGRVKRQGSREPIRIFPFYDSSVDSALPADKASMLRTETIPKLIEFFQNSLSVTPIQGFLTFRRMCTGGSFFPTTNLNAPGCVSTCTPTTTCGRFNIPEKHLQQCIQCNGAGSQSCVEVGGTNVQGVNETDLVLYISANGTDCPSVESGASKSLVAVATSCQMEASTDRPIAGNINFCPLGVTGNAADFILEVAKHEVTHVLAFASSLFAFWRDEAGNPRTPRNSQSNLPMNIHPGGFFEPSSSTVQFDVTYNDWRTINGVVSHSVIHMVTPAVLREARDHFNCPTLPGVELENQGGAGTEISHWEKRIFGNEAMTGIVTFNPVFSRVTFAAFEDSGWYTVNYSMAQPLAWGRGSGCRFATGSCLEWISTRNSQSLSVTPFCTVIGEFGCTSDYSAVGKCNLMNGANPSIEYQYFTNRTQGGGIEIADFCPFHIDFEIRRTDNRVTGTDCTDPRNLPTENALVETYSDSSRCFQHGTRTWTNTRFTSFTTRSGCYQFACSPTSSVTVIVGSLAYQCQCEGEEIRFTFTESGAVITGSIICPACSQICFDNLSNCPNPENATCYGRVTNQESSDELPVTLVTPRVTFGPGNGAEKTGAIAIVICLMVIIVTVIF